jgi:hypothetical protein
MVGHENVGMECASLLLQGFTQPVEVSVMVLIAKEARFTVVSALDDLQRDVIKMNTGSTWHDATVAEDSEPNLFGATNRRIYGYRLGLQALKMVPVVHLPNCLVLFNR